MKSHAQSYIDNQYVSFQIIKKNDKGKVYLRCVWVVIIIFMCMAFFSDRFNQVFNGIGLTVCLGSLIFLGIKRQLTKEYDVLGQLTFYPDAIVIQKEGCSILEVPVLTVNLSFELRGYYNEPIIGEWLYTKKGLDNYISIYNSSMRERHEILISNKLKINIFERLLSHYIKQGVKIRYTDSSDEASKASIFVRLLWSLRYYFNK